MCVCVSMYTDIYANVTFPIYIYMLPYVIKGLMHGGAVCSAVAGQESVKCTRVKSKDPCTCMVYTWALREFLHGTFRAQVYAI